MGDHCFRLLIANCARIGVPGMFGCGVEHCVGAVWISSQRLGRTLVLTATRAASSVASGGCAVFGSDSPGLERQLSSAA
jgi:hypothetical protein